MNGSMVEKEDEEGQEYKNKGLKGGREEGGQKELPAAAVLPMVEMKVVLKASSENLKRMHVLPTPESPIRSSLNNRS